MSKFYIKEFDINLSKIRKKPKLFNNEDKLLIKSEKNNSKISSQGKQNSSQKNFYSKINNIIELKKISLRKVNYKKNENKKDFITISELYNMPNSKTRTINFFPKSRINISPLNKNKKNDINNNNFRFLMSNNNSINNSEISKKIIDIINKKKNIHNLNISKKTKILDHFANLPNFMKDRFYSDIEDKLIHQFRNKPFYYDTSLRDKIIQLNQIKEFWGGMSDYTNPILCTKRVRYLSRLIEDRKNLRENNGLIFKLVKKRNKKLDNSIPKLYINSHMTEKKREKIRNKMLFGKEKRNKTEENMQYFI